MVADSLNPGTVRLSCRATLGTGQIVEVSNLVADEMYARPEILAHVEADLREELVRQICKEFKPVIHVER